jgi:hypothetical protein
MNYAVNCINRSYNSSCILKTFQGNRRHVIFSNFLDWIETKFLDLKSNIHSSFLNSENFLIAAFAFHVTFMSKGVNIIFAQMEDVLFKLYGLQNYELSWIWILYTLDVLICFDLLAFPWHSSHHRPIVCTIVLWEDKVQATEVCFKARSHQLPRGCPEYHQSYKTKVVIHKFTLLQDPVLMCHSI